MRKTIGNSDPSNLGQTVQLQAGTAVGTDVPVLRLALAEPQAIQLTLTARGTDPSNPFTVDTSVGIWEVEFGSGGAIPSMNRVLLDAVHGVTIPLHASFVNVNYRVSVVPTNPQNLTACVGSGVHATTAPITFTEYKLGVAAAAAFGALVPPYAKRATVYRDSLAQGVTVQIVDATGVPVVFGNESLAALEKGQPFDIPNNGVSVLCTNPGPAVANYVVVFELGL